MLLPDGTVASAARVFVRGRRAGRARPAGASRRPVFVVGSPRSGTTFLAGALGDQPGLVDLGELKPVKGSVAGLVRLPAEQGARSLRRSIELVRRLAIVRELRGVEQTPELAFVLDAVLVAYPDARIVHLLRDGRDVACSLLERGWLTAGRDGADDVRGVYGPHARFWVEPGREEEFTRASDATRAAWAWRSYAGAVRRTTDRRLLELRYEQLASDPAAVADALAEHLGLEPGPLAASLFAAHARSVGRYRDELTAEQLADVEREAGPLLRELGYS